KVRARSPVRIPLNQYVERIPLLDGKHHREVDADARAMGEISERNAAPLEQSGPDRSADDDDVGISCRIQAAGSERSVEGSRNVALVWQHVISDAFGAKHLLDIFEALDIADRRKMP